MTDDLFGESDFATDLAAKLSRLGVTPAMERERCAGRLRRMAADARKHAAEASGPRADAVSAIFIANAAWIEDAAKDIANGFHWLLEVEPAA